MGGQSVESSVGSGGVRAPNWEGLGVVWMLEEGLVGRFFLAVQAVLDAPLAVGLGLGQALDWVLVPAVRGLESEEGPVLAGGVRPFQGGSAAEVAYGGLGSVPGGQAAFVAFDDSCISLLDSTPSDSADRDCGDR